MNISVSCAEIALAPVEVQTWFVQKLGVSMSMPAEVLGAVIGDAEAPETKNPVQGMRDEISAAKEKAKGAKKESTAKVDKPLEPAKPAVPTAEEVMQRAVDYSNEMSTDALKAVLKKVGISRVKECPQEKRAELLAAMAVA